MKICRGLLVWVLLICAGAPSKASIIQTYTNRVAWEAAVITFSTETFTGLPLGVLPVGTTPLGLIDLTYLEPSSASVSPRIVEPGGIPGARALSVSVGIDSPFTGQVPSTVTLTLPDNATAFGAYFTSATSAAGLAISITGDLIFLDPYFSNDGTGFFGFISDISFQDLILSAPNAVPSLPLETFNLNDVSFNQAPLSTPEPSSLSLFCLAGILGVIARLRSK